MASVTLQRSECTVSLIGYEFYVEVTTNQRQSLKSCIINKDVFLRWEKYIGALPIVSVL